MVDGGQAVADELFRDIGQTIATALRLLLWGEGLPLSNIVEYVTRTIGHSSVEFAVFVVIVSSAHAAGSVFGHSGQFQRLAVVKRRVAAAMMDHDRMFLGDLVKIVDVELAVVLYLCVIEEIA